MLKLLFKFITLLKYVQFLFEVVRKIINLKIKINLLSQTKTNSDVLVTVATHVVGDDVIELPRHQEVVQYDVVVPPVVADPQVQFYFVMARRLALEVDELYQCC